MARTHSAGDAEDNVIRIGRPADRAAQTESAPTSPSTPDARPLFLSVADAAETLGVSADTVYGMVQRGELPCLRLGRRRVVPHRAIEVLAEALIEDFHPDDAIRGPGPTVA